ncbi:MAG: C40 family peptidase, partial [Pseudomonadota bacterium]
MSLLRWLLVMLLLAACNTAAGEAVPEDSWVADAAAMPSDRIVRALALLGTPYRKRGVSPESGFDCSGFVGWVFRQTGVDLPRTAQQMYHAIGEKVERAAVRPGDLLFFRIGRQGRAINHVAIAIGDGRFVHSPATGGVVRIESLDIPY